MIKKYKFTSKPFIEPVEFSVFRFPQESPKIVTHFDTELYINIL